MSLPLQELSEEIWIKKYKADDEKTVKDTYTRVAKALASVEDEPSLYEDLFLETLLKGAIPGGRIMFNAGRNLKKTSLINCVVSESINDSMEDILEKVKRAGMTLKAGCGIGYNFSTLRPKGSYIDGVSASTSGPVSFMDIFDSMCFTIASAGGRRGAQMGVMSVSHPDVMSFIEAKRQTGKLRHFNLSVLITNDFMKALSNKEDWKLVFPISKKEYNSPNIENIELVWQTVPSYVNTEEYVKDEKGLICHKVYKTVKTQDLWDTIMKSCYTYAEPGVIFIDKINYNNNNRYIEDIVATNPCGEQPLPENGACLLGSINLTNFVNNPFNDDAKFDFKELYTVAKTFTRMLDNVVELSNMPLKEQEFELKNKRRHGMGFMGLGSVFTMMNLDYGSEVSLELAEKIIKTIVKAGWEMGIELAKEKGAAPIFDTNVKITPELKSRYDIDYNLNENVPYIKAFANTPHMEKVFSELLDDSYYNDYMKYGCRFTHHSSIAPTGTIALSLANNASNGIEPSFAHHYVRNVIEAGKNTKRASDVFSYEALLYKNIFGKMPNFKTAEEVSLDAHLNMQAVVQKWVDSSISKTINVKTDVSFDEFKNIYLKAYKLGLKGCTVFRPNQEINGVLVTKETLESKEFTFKLKDGTEIKAKGNELLEYEGQVTTAVNLYDAIKEGYYGKN